MSKPTSKSFLTCEICVLAGGASRRMGKDKSRLRLGTRTVLNIIRTTARSTGLPVRVIRKDLVPRCGPLGGVYTALHTSDAAAVLFLACDMPFVSRELLQRVLAKASAKFEGIFVETDRGAGLPFILRRTALPRVCDLLSRRKLSLQALANLDGMTAFRPPRSFSAQFANINTPQDWARAVRNYKSKPKNRARNMPSKPVASAAVEVAK